MAGIGAIHSVGVTLASFLRNTMPGDLRTRLGGVSFEVWSSKQMNEPPDQTTVSLFLYRVTVSEHLRNFIGTDRRARPPLPLDLHWMITVWAGSAEAEHTLLAWVMRQLYEHESLTSADLTAGGEWEPDTVIQIIPAELGTEDMTRIWDALTPPYHLSVSYIARAVRIDPARVEPDAPPVVSRRIELGPKEPTRA